MKVKVRIAVAANAAGEWAAYGYPTKEDWASIMDSFDGLEDEQRFWIEAEIEVRDDIPIIQGATVKTAE